ncbi:MAG: cryptochrome/photolyase family protein [Gemmobacter sp.]
MPDAPLILWFRRDLRLSDHPMLTAAVDAGRPLLPLFILDPETEALGAAAKWRLGEGLAVFAAMLERAGSRLTFRRGAALDVLRAVIAETGAAGVHWSRLYDPASRARDEGVKSALRAEGRIAVSHPGHLLHEPWTVMTGQGGPYRVYTLFWNAVAARDCPAPLPRVTALPPPQAWPVSDRLEDWHLGAAMRHGGAVVAAHTQAGEAAAEARADAFLAGPVGAYGTARNRVDQAGTSGLSPHLALGEIGVRRLWHGGVRAEGEGRKGAFTFRKELVWRDFAHHLLYHYPTLPVANWKPEWDAFSWRADNDDAEAWRRGMTGEPFVDAGMREMYVTGTMHNRARMIVASYLTKHLMTDWRIGAAWFDDCLTDWDPASNAMGWQWAAGSGPDAAPYFRIFNPTTQGETHDPAGTYRTRWIAERSAKPGADALSFFDAVPRSWQLDPRAPYPGPIVDLAAGRARALAAYAARNT